MTTLTHARLVPVLWMTLSLALVGCDRRTFVDGLPIGAKADCSESCDRFFQTAESWLDEAAPDHSPVVATEAFGTNYTINPQRSGGRDMIIVLRLEDGSARAIHIGCGIGIDPDPCFAWESAPNGQP